ncbi:hypothetical protein, partial [Marinilabilia salmonicolor]|uniref:hypothetical protein n=1 Tax=Marinilabilia salmonicolor TaxID=989 RepID=UPI001F356F15
CSGTGYVKTVQPVPIICIGIRVCEGGGGVICYPIPIVWHYDTHHEIYDDHLVFIEKIYYLVYIYNNQTNRTVLKK